MSPITRLLLVRHAHPDEKAQGRCYGALDISLSSSGRLHARQLARRLGRIPLSAVYSSPLKRAVDTAAPIAAAHELTTTVDDDLREIDFGDFEGRSYAEIEQGHPEVYRQWMETPTLVQFPGGESYATVRRRAVGAMEALRERHRGGTIAVVSHGGVLRAMLAECLSMPDHAIFRLEQGYGSVSVVDWIDQAPLVRLVNAQMEMVGQRDFLRAFARELVAERNA